MKLIRLLHIALSCLFAPVLILYAMSGAELTQPVEELLAQNQDAEVIVYNMHKIHQEHRLSTNIKEFNSQDPYKALVVVAALGIVLTSILGIIAGLGTPGGRLLSLIFLLLGLGIPAIILWTQ